MNPRRWTPALAAVLLAAAARAAGAAPLGSPAGGPRLAGSPAPAAGRAATPTPIPAPTYCLNPNASDGYLLADQGRTLCDATGVNGCMAATGTVRYAAAPYSGRTNAVTGFSGPWDPRSNGCAAGPPTGFLAFPAGQEAAFSGLAQGGFSCGFDLTETPAPLMTLLSWDDSVFRRVAIDFDGGACGDTLALEFDGGGVPFGGALNVGGPNTVAVWWANNLIYGFVNGSFTASSCDSNPGYGVGFKTGSVSNLTLGANHDVNSTGCAGRPFIGYVYDVHFYTSGRVPFALGRTRSDACGTAPRPTLTPAVTYLPTPTPDATPWPQCRPTPAAVLTVGTSPIITAIPTPHQGGSGVAEPDLELAPWDARGNRVHVSYSWEGPGDHQVIRLATSTGLHPAGDGMLTPPVDRGILVGDGVLGVTDPVHGSNQVHISGGLDRLYWADGKNGNVYRADSLDGGYHYLTSTVAVACAASQFSAMMWSPGSNLGSYTMAVARDPAVATKYWGIAELDNASAYGPYGADLLWLVESTDRGRNFRLASPLPLDSALFYGSITQGPRALTWDAKNRVWDLWVSITQSGPIYRESSRDLFHWAKDGAWSVSFADIPAGWVPRLDQLADVSGGVEDGGYWWFAATAMDNADVTGVAFLFWYPGTQADYDRCADRARGGG